MSIILGFNSGHDGAVALIKDGQILAAVGTERVTRTKKQSAWEQRVIDYVLDAAGITFEQVDHLVCVDNEQRFVSQPGKFTDRAPGREVFGEFREMTSIPHHLAHAAAAYYTSPFDESWCLTWDSSWGRPEANASVCYGKGLDLTWRSCPILQHNNDDPNKPYEHFTGCLYSVTTERLGLGPATHKAGTTMGLACYGRQIIPDYDFNNFDPTEPGDIKPLWAEDFQDKADIALTMQDKFEKAILEDIAGLDESKTDNLCLGGGSMLNCTLNGKIVKQSKFKDFHLFPGCGDDGLAVGAALYFAHHILREPRHSHTWAEQCYTGKDYPLEQEPDYDQIAKLLARGNIIGWFHGKSEFGPRALGNRSILADPRTYHTRERINHHIKNREWFRPFAPVVLEEEADKWFDWQIPSPFMLYTAQVRRPGDIQAVTHVDNSARLQTINKETNEPYYNIISKFGEITGVPVLLNTSLNDNGQPIIETPEEALEFLRVGKLDYMVINGVLHKREQ